MNLTELSRQIAGQFRRTERAAPGVYVCDADRDADLAYYILTCLLTGRNDTGLTGPLGVAPWPLRWLPADSMINDLTCEVEWVVQGADQVCGAAPTRSVYFRNGPKRACDQCAVDLSDFEQYHVERELAAGEPT